MVYSLLILHWSYILVYFSIRDKYQNIHNLNPNIYLEYQPKIIYYGFFLDYMLQALEYFFYGIGHLMKETTFKISSNKKYAIFITPRFYNAAVDVSFYWCKFNNSQNNLSIFIYPHYLYKHYLVLCNCSFIEK